MEKTRGEKDKGLLNWTLVEESCHSLNVGKSEIVQNITYHPLLNVLLVLTSQSNLYVLDLLSSNVCKSVTFNEGSVKMEYVPSLERLVTTNQGVFSLRKHLNGLLFLDNVFQQPINFADDQVTLELSLNDAIQLHEALTSCTEATEEEHFKSFLQQLQTSICAVKLEAEKNKNKWVTVLLKGNHNYMYKLLSHLLLLLKQTATNLPGHPILSCLVDQLTLLQPTNQLQQPKDPVDKAVMHNECARLETFKHWPHLDHKWALPKPMCQAGFYFNPTNPSLSQGDDRAMCFACNVSLIYWEANDEPWSEHERHSPSCPFAKGEYTSNVPIAATHATEPAQLHSAFSQISGISTTSSDRLIATISHNNLIVLWDCHTFLRKSMEFFIDPNDSLITTALLSHHKRKNIKFSRDNCHSQALCLLSTSSKLQPHTNDTSSHHTAAASSQPSSVAPSSAPPPPPSFSSSTSSVRQYLIVGACLKYYKTSKKRTHDDTNREPAIATTTATAATAATTATATTAAGDAKATNMAMEKEEEGLERVGGVGEMAERGIGGVGGDEGVKLLNKRNEQLTEVFKKQGGSLSSVDNPSTTPHTVYLFTASEAKEVHKGANKEAMEDTDVLAEEFSSSSSSSSSTISYKELINEFPATTKPFATPLNTAVTSATDSATTYNTTVATTITITTTTSSTTSTTTTTSATATFTTPSSMGSSTESKYVPSAAKDSSAKSREKSYLCLMVYDLTKSRNNNNNNVKNSHVSLPLNTINKAASPVSNHNNSNLDPQSSELTCFLSNSFKAALDYFPENEDDDDDDENDVKIIGVTFPSNIKLHKHYDASSDVQGASATHPSATKAPLASLKEPAKAIESAPFGEEIFEGISYNSFNNHKDHHLQNDILYNNINNNNNLNGGNNVNNSNFKTVDSGIFSKDSHKEQPYNRHNRLLVQAIKLPDEVQSRHACITHILHTDDNFILVVVTSQGAKCSKGKHKRASEGARSWILTYLITHQHPHFVSEQPLMSKSFSEAFVSTTLLPSQLLHQAILNDEEDVPDDEMLMQQFMSHHSNGDHDNNSSSGHHLDNEGSTLNTRLERMCQTTAGALMTLTTKGSVLLTSCRDLSPLVRLDPPLHQPYVAATFCGGIDKVCLTNSSNVLKYFSLTPSSSLSSSSLSSSSSSSVSLEAIGADDNDTARKKRHRCKAAHKKSANLLVRERLSCNTLILLHHLITSEGVPFRFAFVKPFCWKELSQPETSQHTTASSNPATLARTWKLPSDLSFTNEDNSFELLLSEASLIDHVFIRFVFRSPTHLPLAPPLKITLLKHASSHSNRKSSHEKINFGFGVSSHSDANSDINSPNDSYVAFLENKYKAKVACGPRMLCTATECSELQGSVHMSSRLLLKERCKSLIVHFKGGKEKGVSFIKEVSIKVRKFKKAGTPFEALTRSAMLEDASFHERLLRIMSGQPTPSSSSSSSSSSSAPSTSSQPSSSSSTSSQPSSSSSSSTASQPSSSSSTTSQPSSSSQTSTQPSPSTSSPPSSSSSTQPPAQPSTSSPSSASSQPSTSSSSSTSSQPSSSSSSSSSSAPLQPSPSSSSSSLMGRDLKMHLCFEVFMWLFNCTRQSACPQQQRELIGAVGRQLSGLLSNCFIRSDRSIAHQCTRLLCACVSLSRELSSLPPPSSSSSSSPPPSSSSSSSSSFESVLLGHLLEHLPHCLVCPSSGSLSYFFNLLHHLSPNNPSLVAQTAYQLLTTLTTHYSKRSNHQHDFLRTRLGLYGTPLDATIYELNPILINSTMLFLAFSPPPPSSSVQQQQPPKSSSKLSYAIVAGNNQAPQLFSTPPHSSIHPSMFPNESVFADIINLLEFGKHSMKRSVLCEGGVGRGSSCGGGGGLLASKEEYVSRFLGGLMEMEPLHFTVTNLSDGCRVEKMDAGGTQPLSSALQQPQDMQMCEPFLYPSILPDSQQAPGPSSSTSYSDDSIYKFLHCKEFMLMKLQMQKKKLEHKLAETSKLMISETPDEKLFAKLASKKNNLTSNNNNNNNNNTLTHNDNNNNFPHKNNLSLNNNTISSTFPPTTVACNNIFSNINLLSSPPTSSPGKTSTNNLFNAFKEEQSSMKNPATSSKLPQAVQKLNNVFQMPVPQVLNIVYHGGRKHVVLEFGRLVCLTDLFVPFCNDVGVLIIDTWAFSEEKDGQRLVEATDISNNNLVLTDLLPPVLCTCLKMTVVRKSGDGSSKLKVPIGAFFGHTLPSPWQLMSHASSYQRFYTLALRQHVESRFIQQNKQQHKQQDKETHPQKPNGGNDDDDNDDRDDDDYFSSMLSSERDKYALQLDFYKSLLEEIQCSFNLSRSKLRHLVSMEVTSGRAEDCGSLMAQREFGPKEEKLAQVYYETLQLQIQLNLAKRAIERLQRMMGLVVATVPSLRLCHLRGEELEGVLANTSTDHLRFVCDHLMETIFSTVSQHPLHFHPTTPSLSCPLNTLKTSIQLVSSLDEALWLFKRLCTSATSPKTQLSCSLFLLHHCHLQPWWGQLLCRLLQEFFSSQQKLPIPQDRLFLLLVLLAQRSLLNTTAAHNLLHSTFSLLNSLLLLQPSSPPPDHPFNQSSFPNFNAHPDLKLVTWVLLLLHQSLDYMASVFICHHSPPSGVTGVAGDSETSVRWLTSPVPFSTESRWSFITAHDSITKPPLSLSSSASFSQDPLSGSAGYEASTPESGKKASHKKKMVHKLMHKLKHTKEAPKKHLWKPDVPSFVNNVFKEILSKFKPPNHSQKLNYIKILNNKYNNYGNKYSSNNNKYNNNNNKSVSTLENKNKNNIDSKNDDNNNQDSLNNNNNNNNNNKSNNNISYVDLLDHNKPDNIVCIDLCNDDSNNNNNDENNNNRLGNKQHFSSGCNNNTGLPLLLSDDWVVREWSPVCLVSRTHCVTFARSLAFLATNNIHSDLFIIVCRLLARVMTGTRPVMSLVEVMDEQVLEDFLWTTCKGSDGWRLQALVCLLQDLLEGEKAQSTRAGTQPHTPSRDDFNSRAIEIDKIITFTTEEDSDDEDDKDVVAAGGSGADDDDNMVMEDQVELMDISDDQSEIPADNNEASAPDSIELEFQHDLSFIMEEMVEELSSTNKQSSPLEAPHAYFDSEDLLQWPSLGDKPLMGKTTSNNNNNNNNNNKNNNNNNNNITSTTNNNSITPTFLTYSMMMSGVQDPSQQSFTSQWNQPKSSISPLVPTPPKRVQSGNTSREVTCTYDLRLEQGLNLVNELELKKAVRSHANLLYEAFSQPLPLCPPPIASPSRPVSPPSSSSLLHTSFSHLFKRLPATNFSSKGALPKLLSLFFRVNNPSNQPISRHSHSLVAISDDALKHLVACVAATPVVADATWLDLFRVLILLHNNRSTHAGDYNVINDDNFVLLLHHLLTGNTSLHSRTPLSPPSSGGPLLVLVLKQLLTCVSRGHHDNQLLINNLLQLVTKVASPQSMQRHACGLLDLQTTLVLCLIDLIKTQPCIVTATAADEAKAVHDDAAAHDDHRDGDGVASQNYSKDGKMGLAEGFKQEATGTPHVVVSLDKQVVVAAVASVAALVRWYMTEEEEEENAGKKQKDHRGSLSRTCYKNEGVVVTKSDKKSSKKEPSSQPATSQAATSSSSSSSSFQPSLASFSSSSSSSRPQNTPMQSLMCLLVRLSDLLVGLPLWPHQTSEQATKGEGESKGAGVAEVVGIGGVGVKCSHKSHGRREGCGVVADEVLKYPSIMTDLLCSVCLCHCHPPAALSNTPLLSLDHPSSLADWLICLVNSLNCKSTDLKLVVEAVYAFLASNDEEHADKKLSEPLYWLMVERVLDCEASVQAFISLGGASLVPSLLVQSVLPSRHFFSSLQQATFIAHSPHQASLSTNVMQFFSASKLIDASTDLKFANTVMAHPIGNISYNVNTPADHYSNLQNFAPLGTITSSVPQANPSQLLIQEFPAPRRSRSASWTYQYPPSSDWVDVVVALPCSILLTEVILMPHSGSLENCPSMVVVETSEVYRGCPSPLASCVNSAGASYIRVRHAGRVASVVTIHLRRPLDTNRLGLSQVLLLGSLAFTSNISNTQHPDSPVCSDTLHWLRLLQHCISRHFTADGGVFIAAATDTPRLMHACFSLLFHTASRLYVRDIEEVLLLLSRSSKPLSTQLLSLILNAHDGPVCNAAPHHGHGDNATSVTVNMLYQLCVGSLQGGRKEDGKKEKTKKEEEEEKEEVMTLVKLLLQWLSYQPTFEAATLASSSVSSSPSFPITCGPSSSIISCIASVLWRLQASGHHSTALSTALDACLFRGVFNWFTSILKDTPLSRSLGQLLSSIFYIKPSFFPQALEWMGLLRLDRGHDDSHQTTDAPESPPRCSVILHNLSKASLSSLSLICKTPACLSFLQTSGFVAACCLFIKDFFERRPPTAAGDHNDHKEQCSQADVILALLNFFKQICLFPHIKTLLGSGDHCLFWAPMLQYACSPHPPSETFLDYEHLLNMENSVVAFLGSVTLNHPHNQLLLSHLLINTINSSTTHCCSVFQQPLPGLLKSLILQVLLEDERSIICLHSLHPCIQSPHPSPFLPPPALFHPRCGAGLSNIVLSATLTSSIADVVAAFSDYAVADAGTKISGGKRVVVLSESLPGVALPGDLRVAQLLPLLKHSEQQDVCLHLMVDLLSSADLANAHHKPPPPNTSSLSSILEVFSSIGGLALLAEKLPFFMPQPVQSSSFSSSSTSPTVVFSKASSNLASSPPPHHKWTHLNMKKKMIANEYLATIPDVFPFTSKPSPFNPNAQQHSFSSQHPYSVHPPQAPPRQNVQTPSKQFVIPPHTMVCFSLALRLPCFSEELLKNGKKARCMLKIMLGAIDQDVVFDSDRDQAGSNNAFSAPPLSHFPFNILSSLLHKLPLGTAKGDELRVRCMEVGVVHLTLACISVFGHHDTRKHIPGLYQEVLKVANQSQQHMFKTARSSGSKASINTLNSTHPSAGAPIDSPAQGGVNPSYWAKGTGFGTGSTASNWDAKHLLMRQKVEEEHVANLLKGGKKKVSSSSFMTSSVVGRMSESQEEKYISVMKHLQYDTYRMVVDDGDAVVFSVPHHYEAKVLSTGEVSSALRARRLAQETVTLSTSLPLSLGSSVFVRCDEERLDVMKVLITGPTDTPYSNGCFEFDVFFPADYPHSPPLINMQTTGGNSIRFNPNLYNDGKVCLSIINTWHGRPEEKWNSQTSSLLQVLVSIQSLILVHEPYFNEPGYERSKGTNAGTASSREYDANIRQATVRWAMLELIRHPPDAFKQIIQWHFWLKREEILAQVMAWLVEMETYCGEKRVGKNISMSLACLKKHYNDLKTEFDNMQAPEEVGSWNFQLTSSEEEDEEEDDGEGIYFEAAGKV